MSITARPRSSTPSCAPPAPSPPTRRWPTTPDHLVFEVVSAIAREGRSMKGVGLPGPQDDLTALLDTVLDAIPAPAGDADRPLQALVTNLDASDYLGRLAIGRVVNGVLRKGETVALLEADEGVAPLRRRLSQ